MIVGFIMWLVSSIKNKYANISCSKTHFIGKARISFTCKLKASSIPMSPFSWSCSRDISVVVCGSSVKTHGKASDALDSKQRKLWLYLLVFLVEKECVMWTWILDWKMLPFGLLGRFLPALKWVGAEKRISALLLKPLSPPLILNLNKNHCSFSGRCLICDACTEVKLH